MSTQLHNGFKVSLKGEEFITSPYRRQYPDKRALAKAFFSLMSSFNNLKLTNGELNILAHIAVHGVTINAKRAYVEEYGSSLSSLNNVIGILIRKKKVLVKLEGKIRINPKISPDFINNDNFIFSFKCVLINQG